MKAGKNYGLPLLLLCCALSLSGCGLLGGGDEGQSRQTETENVKKAQDELTAAQIKLSQNQEAAKKTASDLADAADKESNAREKAETFRAVTENQNKNPDDERESPNTVAATKAYEEAKTKADGARKADATAKAGVQDAKVKVDEAAKKLEAARNPDISLVPGWLLYALAAVVGIVALVAVGYLLKRLLTASRARTQQAFVSVTAGHERSTRQLENLIVELGRKTDAHFSQQNRDVETINGRIDTLRQGVEVLRLTLAAAPPPPPPHGGNQGAIEVREQSPFPVSVAEHLNRVRHIAIVVKSSINDILVRDPDSAGELALVEHSSAAGGLPYVVPTVVSFKTKQEFHSYYEKYYDCHRPAGGEVWINKPAVVGRVNGGWELVDKGELEVR